jgi:hypothetical protein
MDILHINKQKIKIHYKQTYDKNQKNKTRIKQNINLRQNYLTKKKKKKRKKKLSTKQKKKKTYFFGGCLKIHFSKFQAPPYKRKRREVPTNKVAKQQMVRGRGSEGTSR